MIKWLLEWYITICRQMFVFCGLRDHIPRPFATAKYSHIQYVMFMFILVVDNSLKLQTCFERRLSFWNLQTIIQWCPQFWTLISELTFGVLGSVLCLVLCSCNMTTHTYSCVTIYHNCEQIGILWLVYSTNPKLVSKMIILPYINQLINFVIQSCLRAGFLFIAFLWFSKRVFILLCAFENAVIILRFHIERNMQNCKSR